MQLQEKLGSRKAVIGIIGLGYVGLPLMLRYVEVGCRVVGFDVDSLKVDALNNGNSYIEHIPSSAICQANAQGFSATVDYSLASEVDALIICVLTPLNNYREPDLSFATSTMDSLPPYIRADQIVPLESTTYPGTTDEELLLRIESTGLKVGKSFYLVYSPERDDSGNLDFVSRTIPKVCGGVMDKCRDIGLALYRQVIDQVVLASSTRTVEITKLLENIHRAVNIGLVNELDCGR